MASPWLLQERAATRFRSCRAAGFFLAMYQDGGGSLRKVEDLTPDPPV